MYSRPTFMGFQATKTAIFANQKSLDIVGNNLSNVNTAGYTRQNVARASMVVPSYAAKTGSSTIGLAGQGVQSLGVSQTRDAFLDNRFREQYSNSAYNGQAASVLEDIQIALGDGFDITSESGLYSGVIEIYQALNNYISDPTSESLANIVQSAFTNVTQILQQMDRDLTAVADTAIVDLELDVARVNEIAVEIAQLNQIIEETGAAAIATDTFYSPNELYDARNLLLDELSAYGNISVVEGANCTINVSLGDFEIVNGSHTETLNLVSHDNSTVSLNWVSTGESYSSSSGTLLANIHIINGAGSNVQDSIQEPYKGIQYYKNQLNTFASAIADVANNTIPEMGEDGNPLLDEGGNIVYKTLIGADIGTGTTSKYGIDASNITISTDWTINGAGYFIYNSEEYIEDYAQQLALKLTESPYTFTSGGDSFTGSFLDFQVNLMSQLGTDISYFAGRQDAYALIANDLLTQRDAVAGVSTDEETADMLIYQKSYEAASRMMTVFDELLDVIINSTGLVGR